MHCAIPRTLGIPVLPCGTASELCQRLPIHTDHCYEMTRSSQRAAFFHLDLGVGGAEQLVLQAALQTQKFLHGPQCTTQKVDVFTSYFDSQRCMEAAKDPKLNVIVFGSFLPHCIMGRFRVACSLVRMLYLVVAAIFTGHVGYDVVFNDQVALVNPLLRLIGKKVVFYGHFPDLLLVRRQPSLLWRLYRYLFDKLEARTTGMCDLLLVNSEFTAETFTRTFPSLRKDQLRVLYPPISTDVEGFDVSDAFATKDSFSVLHGFDFSSPFALSLNRFEEKKNIELAIRAVASLQRSLQCNLIVAGGFDPRLSMCSDYFHRLVKLAKQLDFHVLGDTDMKGSEASPALNDKGRRRCVLFLKNISGPLKLFLLRKSSCLLYTPTEEHFGITPCEAMYVGCLPIACNTGGPRETIVDGETGFLCNPNVESFSVALNRILSLSLKDSEDLDMMRFKARMHAEKRFSPGVFGRSLNVLLEEAAGIPLVDAVDDPSTEDLDACLKRTSVYTAPIATLAFPTGATGLTSPLQSACAPGTLSEASEELHYMLKKYKFGFVGSGRTLGCQPQMFYPGLA